MSNKCLTFVVAMAIASPASLVVAQAPSVVAAVTAQLSVSAGNAPPSVQPVGPLPASGVTLTASSMLTSASMVAGVIPSGLPNASRFRLNTSGTVTPSFSAPPAFSVSGAIVLTLTMPTPTPVRIAIGGSATAAGGANGSTRIDIDNNGSFEATVSPTSGAVPPIDVVVGPTGLLVRVVHSSSGVWLGSSPNPSFSSNTQLTFEAGVATVASYGSSCFALAGNLDPDGELTMSCAAPNGSLALFAAGFTQVSVALPIAPGCLLLVDPIVIDVALPAAGIATFVRNVVPPPGGSVFHQAAILDANGMLTTSNGLVVTGL